MLLRNAILATTLTAATSAFADVTIYTTRQPDLIQPVMDAFTAQTGIGVRLNYVDDGLVERLKAEGRRSPADLIGLAGHQMTVGATTRSDLIRIRRDLSGLRELGGDDA